VAVSFGDIGIGAISSNGTADVLKGVIALPGGKFLTLDAWFLAVLTDWVNENAGNLNLDALTKREHARKLVCKAVGNN
jgi:hypothetical protein